MKLRINEWIRTSPVRLIGAENNQIGVVPVNEAMDMARQAGLDLVEIAPEASPPVCRIMDFGKYLYELKRKEKQNVKKQHAVTLKEIRLRPTTDEHDCQTKLNHARAFFEKGHKVQFTLMFRGREMLHVEQGKTLMQDIITKLEDVAKVDRNPSLLGKRMTVMMAPK
ncbi:MAG TPA: translation initiation factor IF-3 [Phycisphaerales bacterium]|nr:MAG: translation initiation factor IF-3 [Planctomycetes bacterium GWC2_45_44]HBG79084.1 translation initiation factor IF-3 [Phycisphaerales bacterium]HBR18914.1 translation initiation factor IF-3 [Phycisphaerales bacterium]